MSTHFGSKQRAFLDFVLGHYVSVGVQELDQDKLTPLLRLKYQNSLADALNDLGRPQDIGVLFSDFQKYLYQDQTQRKAPPPRTSPLRHIRLRNTSITPRYPNTS